MRAGRLRILGRLVAGVVAGSLGLGLLPAFPAVAASAGNPPSYRKDLPPLPAGSPPAKKAPDAGPGGVSYSASSPRDSHPGRKAKPVAEVSGDRSSNARVVRDDDGTLDIQQANVPINYQSSQGWAPIDNSVAQVSPGWLGTSANSWTAQFEATAGPMSINAPAGSLSVVPQGTSSSKAAVANPKNSSQDLSTAGAVPGSSTVTYDNAWPQTNLVDTVRTDGVSQDVVITGSGAPSTFGFDITGAAMSLDKSGGVSFDGQFGQSWSIGALRVTDATGSDVTSASNARYSIAGSTLTVNVDGAWLSGLPVASFPVTIDPNYRSVQPNASTSYASTGGSASGVQLGTSGQTIWRAGIDFSMSTYRALGAGYEVYDAQLQFPSYNCSCSSPSSSPLKVWSQTAAVSSYGQIGSGGSPLVEGPWNGTFVEVGANMEGALADGATDAWFGAAYDTSTLQPYSVVLVDINVYKPPAASMVTDLSQGQVLATTTPTLTALGISANPDDPQHQYQMYDYQITTGDTPGAGLVIDSGRLCQNTTGVVNSACVPGNSSVPSWTVPSGVLSEGITYHAWVLTDWFGNNAELPETVPPLDWGIAFTVKLGLGQGGPSPTDSVGSVPGQSSTPASGAPSPGLPGSKLTVNMVDGNASLSVATPNLATVGGGLAVSFTYNSLAMTSLNLDRGLAGSYYNDNSGADSSADQIDTGLSNGTLKQVGYRLDPTVNFGWDSSPAVASQNPGQAVVRWSGGLSFPFTGSWAVGDMSSDGMQVCVGASSGVCPSGDVRLSDWGPHAVQAAPTFGTAFSVTSTAATPVEVDWHHSSSAPQAAQLYAEYFGTTPPTVYAVPSTWLSHPQTILPAGWTLNAGAGSSATWVALADNGTSVTVYAADGSGYEFPYSGAGTYSPPAEDPTASLKIDASGDFVLDDGGLIYTFSPSGALISVVSASDDLNPAALAYTYTASSPPLLSSVKDPVSNRSATFNYGGGSCPAPPAGWAAPPVNQLCQIVFWDGSETNLYYNSNGGLGEIANHAEAAQPVAYAFGYDSSNRLEFIEDPLAFNVVAVNGRPSDCPQGAPVACTTQVIYDASGRVSTVTSPAPSYQAAQPERGYCYGYGQASFSGTTLNCASPSSRVTSLAVAGLTPSVGYSQQDVYDPANRITEVRDSAGLTTTYNWDSSNRLISTVGPDGVETSSAYDSQGNPVNAFGPAPAGDFQANGQPVSGDGVATASTAYDQGMSGLAGAWYPNTTLSGSPVFHNMEAPSASWAGGSSPSSGVQGPSPLQPSGFSGRLTGLVTTPTSGRLGVTGDGATVAVDGHQVLDASGGPYPAAVKADQPGNWWRLGESLGASVAADQSGGDPGLYQGGVTPGQTGPLTDGDSTAAAFNGTSGTVKIPDTPSLDFNGISLQGFTVDAWIKSSNGGSGAQQEIVSKMANASPYTGWEFFTYSGTPCLLLVNNWSTNAIDVCATTTVTDGAWHHVAVTYNGNSNASGVTFYKDGAALTNGTPAVNSLTGSTYNTLPAYIGSRAGQTWWFNGQMSDVAVYPGATLPAARISAHYQAASQTSQSPQTPVIFNSPYPEAVEADTPSGGYWRLADPTGATASADSWGANTGTDVNVTNGQTGGPEGVPPTSANFNGTSSDVTLPQGLFRYGRPFTVEAWFNTPGAAGAIFGEQTTPAGTNPSSGWDNLLYVGADAKLHGGLWPTVLSNSSMPSVNDGRWHQAVLTYDGHGNVALFLDGQQIANGSGASANEEWANAQIGTGWETSWPNATGTGWQPFRGNLGDVALYDTALPPQRIEAHYEAAWAPYATSVLADRPTSLWRLGDPAGLCCTYDWTGPNTLFYGTVTTNPTGPPIGDSSRATTFSGASGSFAAAGDSPSLEFSNTQAFSVEAWVDTSLTSGAEAIASKMANAAPYTGWELGLSNGQPYFYLINNYPNNTLEAVATPTVADGKWHHLVLTYNGSSKAAGVTFYVDGKPVADTIADDTLTASSVENNSLYLGSRANSALFFNGSMADVAIYPGALSSAQVGVHYAAASQTAGSGPNADVHTVTVNDQQYVANGGLSLTGPSGATFDPGYGLATQTTDPDGKVTSTSYTAANRIGPQYGLATTVTQDPGGLNLATTTSYETPGPGSYLRDTAKTLPAGTQTSYVNYCGYITDPTCASPEQSGAWATACGVTQGNSQWGLVAERVDPAPATGAGDAHEEQYLYDPTGRQVGVRQGTVNTIANNGWECTTYDPDGRIATQSWPAFNGQAARTVIYNYAVGGNPLVNNVTDTNSPGAAIATTVDLLDRVVSYSDIYSNVTTTSFDQAGRTITTSGPQGNLTYCYDNAGRPSMTLTSGTCAAPGTDLAASGYDSSGRLTSVASANAVTETLGYDQSGRPSSRTIPTNQASTGETVSYSPAGRIIDQGVYVSGQGLVDANPTGANYTYDGAGRLTQAALPGDTYNYSYGTPTGCPTGADANAGQNTNRTTLTVTGTGGSTTGYCYDNADRLISTSSIGNGQIAYDGHGNTVTQGAQSFNYDSSDRLIRSETPGNVTIYSYDPLDRIDQRTAITPIVAGNTATATATVNTNISVADPPGTNPGDVLVAAITTSAQGGTPNTAGWTLITSTQNGSGTTWVFDHTATSSDPGSWTFNVNSAVANIAGSITDYHNPGTNPVDVSTAANDPSATSQPLPQVTTTGNAETIVDVVGYNAIATSGAGPAAPPGDTQRANLSPGPLSPSLLVSDRYQDQPGQTTAVSASSTNATASEAITVALTPQTSTARLGYQAQDDNGTFTQATTGITTGTSIDLPGGINYSTTPNGTVWSYTNTHGDTISTTDNSGNLTWSGYWGPYGEQPTGVPAPANTALTGATYGYNGALNKLTDTASGITIMGARPYQAATGRFIQPDPIQGGCANQYTYGFGDPMNHPDLSGKDVGPIPSLCDTHTPVWKAILIVGGALVSGGLGAFVASLAPSLYAAYLADGVEATAGDIWSAGGLTHQLIVAVGSLFAAASGGVLAFSANSYATPNPETCVTKEPVAPGAIGQPRLGEGPPE